VDSDVGLKIAGISGNIAKIKRKAHHKTMEEIKKQFQIILGKELDALITYEALEHGSIRSRRMLGYRVISEAIKRLLTK
jgi:hypothetical protein